MLCRTSIILNVVIFHIVEVFISSCLQKFRLFLVLFGTSWCKMLWIQTSKKVWWIFYCLVPFLLDLFIFYFVCAHQNQPMLQLNTASHPYNMFLEAKLPVTLVSSFSSISYFGKYGFLLHKLMFARVGCKQFWTVHVRLRVAQQIVKLLKFSVVVHEHNLVHSRWAASNFVIILCNASRCDCLPFYVFVQNLKILNGPWSTGVGWSRTLWEPSCTPSGTEPWATVFLIPFSWQHGAYKIALLPSE